jgi:hypothetical protein
MVNAPPFLRLKAVQANNRPTTCVDTEVVRARPARLVMVATRRSDMAPFTLLTP